MRALSLPLISAYLQVFGERKRGAEPDLITLFQRLERVALCLEFSQYLFQNYSALEEFLAVCYFSKTRHGIE